MAKVIAVTRPTLAADLIRHGFKPTRIEPSIWDARRTAWLFTLSHELAETALAYYTEYGLTPPRAIMDELARGGASE